MNHLDSTTYFASGIHELVRGCEQDFINELRPLVQAHPVCLDLSSIDRIDAAGLTALICLARDAHRAGHQLAVVHPSHQVARILAVVGLDCVLISKDPEPPPRIDLVAA
jgi:anti-anti-sigma factor